MRFRKGSKVEILSEKDLPSGSWRCGEIVCGDGHSYTVKYVRNGVNSEEVVMERVSRKAIRPPPPLRKGSANWVPGDVVEVHHGFSWRMATISKVLRSGCYLVRLLGSYVEFEVSKSEIRTRQSWEDNKWAVIGKSSGNCDRTTRMRTDVHVNDNWYGGNESNIVSCRTSKRKGGSYMEAETFYGPAPKRFSKTYNEGSLYPEIAAQVSPLTEQVDGVTLGRERLVEEYLHSSFDIINGYCEVEAERRSVATVGCSSAMNLEPDTVRSITCSVGSCSISGDNSRQWFYRGRSAREVDDYCSDAESFCQRESEEAGRALITKQVLAAEIHKLELHAYHCTIVALHASGPLSWDQEAMMTNLRLSLHISNDEHLMEYIGTLPILSEDDATVVHVPGQGLKFLLRKGWPVSGALSSADR